MATNKLSKDDIVKLYEYLYLFETQVKSEAGKFAFDNDAFQRYVKSHKV